MAINHFLIVFNARDEVLLSLDDFGTKLDDATDAYAAKEREYRDRSDRDDYEIVLVGADSRATIEVTHSRYFKRGEVVPF